MCLNSDHLEANLQVCAAMSWVEVWTEGLNVLDPNIPMRDYAHVAFGVYVIREGNIQVRAWKMEMKAVW